MRETKKKILIVDDEDDLTWSISKRLSKDNNGLVVRCASSGSVALKMLNKEHFDLLVTDIRMPGVDGLHLVKEVKNSHPGTPVIVMTAHGSSDIRQSIKSWSHTGYIEKPFEINELRKLIYASLKKQSEFV